MGARRAPAGGGRVIYTQTDFQTALGKKLEALRVERGLTVDAIADIAQVKRRQWYRWEQGENSVPAYAIYRIARELGISADGLLP